jgi:N-acetylglutamate synthase-like GNAT family acetyltransferase
MRYSSNMKLLRVSLLPDDLAAKTVARWQHQEWTRGYGNAPLAEFWREVRQCIMSESIPVVFVAMLGKEIIGTASILENDLPSRCDINPWLGSIFVHPLWRHRGVATALINAAISHAECLQLDELFLFTSYLDEMYARFRFVTVDTGEFMGERVSIMRRDLLYECATSHLLIR